MDDSIFAFGMSAFIIFCACLFAALGYDKGLKEGQCIGTYGTGSTYEDGRCFLPAKQ